LAWMRLYSAIFSGFRPRTIPIRCMCQTFQSDSDRPATRILVRPSVHAMRFSGWDIKQGKSAQRQNNHSALRRLWLERAALKDGSLTLALDPVVIGDRFVAWIGLERSENLDAFNALFGQGAQ